MGHRSKLTVITLLAVLMELTACGGGGGGDGSAPPSCEIAPPAKPSPTLPPLTSPVTVQVSVTVSDPGVTGATLNYKWKATDGSIVDSNAPTTTWTLPNGPGLHFAYVLVSNGFGGYTERRIAVNTDAFGFAAVVPAPTDYVAPAGNMSGGNYYSGYVAGDSILDNTYDEESFKTFKPDALVYLTNLVTGENFPAGGATTPVKTNVRGQFVIPGVTPQPARPDPATPGNYLDNFIVRCSGDDGVTWGDCGLIQQMPDNAVNEGSEINYIAERAINGRFRLADNSACGTANEFFGVETTVTATLLNRALAPIRGPIRLSHEGDYALPQHADAAFVRINCENNAPVLIPIGDNNVNSDPFLGIATLSQVRAPTLTDMTATISNVQVGQFMPPPLGLPSDLIQGREKFMAYRGLDTRKGACEYYKAIGAVKTCDVNGDFTGAISFDDWKRATRMAPYNVNGVTEYTATYINQIDLNLTRNHHSISYGANDTSAYVCNHLGPKDNSQPEINAAIANAVAGKNLIACVVMDHRVSPGVNGDQPFTRFLVFGPDGKLLPSINLDGRSEKFVPGSCVVCHGGDKYAGKFPEDGSGFADIGAHFLPYDIGNFAFSCKPGLTRVDQEESIYQLNQNVAKSSYTPAGAELIAGWYADGTHTMNTNYLPTSWQEANLPPAFQGKGMDQVYHTLIAHSCRTCHVNMVEKYNFDHFENTQDTPLETFRDSTTCGDISNQWRRYSMPNSLVTFNRFWQSPEQVAAYAKLRTTCELRKYIDLGIGELAAGDAHAVNINIDGTLWTRGGNAAGQLGDGTANDSSVPVQIGSDTNWYHVAAGARHTLAIKDEGIGGTTLWAWGDNTYGQLGINSTNTIQTSPVRVGTASNWQQVAAGEQHTVALNSVGQLSAWGNNAYGQLGDATNAESTIPKQIGSDTWRMLAAGAYHTLAIRSDGTLWAWGRNDKGQLGLGDFTDRNAPVQIGSDTNWLYVAAGSGHSLAVNFISNQPASVSTLWGWGDNSLGQLGDGTTTTRAQPTQINNFTGWNTVAASGNHTIGYGAGLSGWGDNASGQLGDNTTTNRPGPVPIPDPAIDRTWWFPWNNRPAVGTGVNFTLGWDSIGYLWSWGDNTYGQLGDGTTAQHLVPTRSLMAPIVKTEVLPAATVAVGEYFQYNFAVFNINGRPLTFGVVTKPGWLTLNANSGLMDTAILSGTPTASGTNDVVLSVSDGLLTTKYAFTITVP